MLDDQLRSVPGFSLFRRTSSRVANPTTQGVTLRGMSASGASRTLVLADGVPLNDPFGAWVYWDRVPVAALQRVDVIRGGSSDLHGNDALGGVIRLTTRTCPGVEAWFEAGRSRQRARLGLRRRLAARRGWPALPPKRATTDGYIVVAPEARGPIDVPADSQRPRRWGGSGRHARLDRGPARGGYFTENRSNGTPAQINATISRWARGSAHGFVCGGVWEARGDLSAETIARRFPPSAANGVAHAGSG